MNVLLKKSCKSHFNAFSQLILVSCQRIWKRRVVCPCERALTDEVRYGSITPTRSFPARNISIPPQKYFVNILLAHIVPFVKWVLSEIRALTQPTSVHDVVGDWINLIIDRVEIAKGQRPV